MANATPNVVPSKMKTAARILIIDDDPHARKTLCDVLRVKGYDVVAAKNGAEGIAEAQRGFVNLALVDLMMPDMSGIEVMERIKAASALTEAIILTGNASLGTAIEATNKGAFSYLLKPYQMEDLLLHVRRGIERERAQEEILRLASHPRLDPNPVIEVGRGGQVTYLNPAAERLFPDLASAGMRHPILVGVEGLYEALRTAAGREIVQEMRQGKAVYEGHVSYVTESDLIRIYAIDVSERKKAQETIEQLRRQLELIVQSTGEGILTLDTNGRHTFVNPAAAKMLGYEPHDLIGCHGHATWQHSTSDGVTYAEEDSAIYQTLTDGQIRRKDDELFWRKDGTSFQVEYVSAPIRSDQVITGVVVTFLDVTERKWAEKEIHALANTDSLTGIANRRVFMRVLETEIARAKRYGTSLALVMYDIDHFKEVNDTYGHDVGDNVLKGVTETVKTNIRAVDLVARWGGEEFMILTHQSSLDHAQVMAEKLRTAIAGLVFGHVWTVTASFGVATFEPHDDAASFLKKVDDALYKAKKNGRNRVEAILSNDPPASLRRTA
jgi:diguanylate cyclase (GGDEF)-like protein/PAS domain S-box-containing protein